MGVRAWRGATRPVLARPGSARQGRARLTLGAAWDIRTDDGLAEAAGRLASAVRSGEIAADDLQRLARDGDVGTLLNGGKAKAARTRRKV